MVSLKKSSWDWFSLFLREVFVPTIPLPRGVDEAEF